MTASEEQLANEQASDQQRPEDQGVGESPPPADEREAAADGAEAAAAQVSEDLDELGAARKERDEYLELAQRTRADFDNYRKRVARDAADALQRGKTELARELIPVIDNLERAMAAGEASQDPAALAKGVALVHAELRGALGRAGLESYDPAGERFDPNLHEAISTHPADGVEPGVVIETLEPGYRLSDQVLRAARVVVSE
jgi:molecular chaperone GrpE